MRKKETIIFLLVMLCYAGKTQTPVADQFHLDLEELRSHLESAPLISTQPSEVTILLPTPEGVTLTFQVWESPLLSAGLQTAYPAYRTYALREESLAYTGRLLLSPAGLDGVVICGEQVLFIESAEPGTDLHRIYYWKLGPGYLSFDLPEPARETSSLPALKLAILTDEAYLQYHDQDPARAIFTSVNGLNAFLQLDQGMQLELQYFGTADYRQILACRRGGFSGRAAESLKLFGDLVAAGHLALTDFDLGHLFSGRGFGSSTLPAVAGSDASYDWNEDGIYDGPAKAGGGSGAVRPTGANWWGNLCKGISRQIGSSDLILTVQRLARAEAAKEKDQVSAALLHSANLLLSGRLFSDWRERNEVDFPHWSFLPFAEKSRLPGDFPSLSVRSKGAHPEFLIRLGSNAPRPWFMERIWLP